MECSKYHDLVQRRLDGRRAVDERHVAECSECRAWLAAVERLEEGLRARRPPVPPGGLTERIVVGVLSQHRRRRRVLYRRLVPLGLAAGLLLAVLGAYALPLTPSAQKVVVTTWRVDESPAKHSGDPALNRNVEEAGSALAALLSRTTDQALIEGRALFPTTVFVPALPKTGNWRAPLEQPVESLRTAGQGVSNGLEPVTSSARRAVHYFLQEIPTKEPSQPRRRG